MSIGRSQEVKNNEKLQQLSPQKVVAVAYERWSPTRGSNYRLLAGHNLVFWISGCLWEVVAHGGSTVFDFGCLDLIEINFAVCHVNSQCNSVVVVPFHEPTFS